MKLRLAGGIRRDGGNDSPGVSDAAHQERRQASGSWHIGRHCLLSYHDWTPSFRVDDHPACATTSRPAPSRSSSLTLRARRSSCSHSGQRHTPRRSPSTAASSGTRAPRKAALRLTPRATLSSSPFRPLPVLLRPRLGGRRRWRLARSTSASVSTPGRRSSPTRAMSETTCTEPQHRGGWTRRADARRLLDGCARRSPRPRRPRRASFQGPGAPERVYQLGDAEFPPLKSLYRSNLPLAANPLVGRKKELAEVLQALLDGSRALTITGPGGVGNTRFALAVAGEAAHPSLTVCRSSHWPHYGIQLSSFPRLPTRSAPTATSRGTSATASASFSSTTSSSRGRGPRARCARRPVPPAAAPRHESRGAADRGRARVPVVASSRIASVELFRQRASAVAPSKRSSTRRRAPSAIGSIACRSRSSSRQPGARRSLRSRSSTACRKASTCCAAAAMPIRASRPCARRSSGVTTFSPTRSSSCSARSPCFAVAARSRPGTGICRRYRHAAVTVERASCGSRGSGLDARRSASSRANV